MASQKIVLKLLLLQNCLAGKKKVKNMNVYLQRLVDELLWLWVDGVEAYDANTGETFKMHSAMLWTMYDYPGYGVCSLLQTQGRKAYPPCGLNNLDAISCPHLKKIIYYGRRKYLPLHHKYRSARNKRLFNNISMAKVPKSQQTNGEFWLRQWHKVKVLKTIKLSDSRMKDKSIFFWLPYYSVCYKDLVINFTHSICIVV